MAVHKFLLFGLLVVAAAVAQSISDPTLTGTWSTKSKKVVTGPVCIFDIPSSCLASHLRGVKIFD